MPVPHIFAGTAGGTTAQLDANWAYFANAIEVVAGGSVGFGTTMPNKLTVTRAVTVNGPSNSAFEVAAGDVSCGWFYGASDRVTLETNGPIPLTFNVNGGQAAMFNTARDYLLTLQQSVPALTVARQLVFNLTSDTNLRITVRGSDGINRFHNLTLAP